MMDGCSDGDSFENLEIFDTEMRDPVTFFSSSGSKHHFQFKNPFLTLTKTLNIDKKSFSGSFRLSLDGRHARVVQFLQDKENNKSQTNQILSLWIK